MTAPAIPLPASAGLPPGPRSFAAARWLRRLRVDPLSTFEDLAATFGDVSAIHLRGSIVAVRGAEGAHRVLVSGQDHYVKGRTFELFRPVLGMGLVTSDGDQWRTSRRIVQPLFAKRHLGVYADHMAAAAAQALEHWDERWSDGRAILLDDEILHIGLDTVSRALVSGDLDAENARIGTAMGGALNELGFLVGDPRSIITQGLTGRDMQRSARFVSPRRWKRYDGFASTIRDVFGEVVDRRFALGQGDRDDLLRLLMESEDPDTGERLSRAQVDDELRTFVAAGHETTAHGLTWMLYLLAANPDARARVERELDDVLGGAAPTAEELPYFTACFQEAMRLYPPAWVIPRTAVQDDVVGGCRIPKGTDVFVSVWATHRDPAVYPDPEVFDPARWLGDAPKGRPRFSYLPFGGGRRACVGQGFAMLNARILGAMVMQRYRFERVGDRPVPLLTSITLRADGGVPMTAHRR
ncbi:MAG: cytochrome P450 [Patulibacter minatonensis]